jgi:hypothetical protein
VVGFLCLAAAPSASAQVCSVGLFREYDPARPPGILTAPPVRQISVTPELDTDAPPPGTRLTFYRVNVQTADPDPLVPLILLRLVGAAVEIEWGGLPGPDTDGDTTPDCADGCPLDPAKTSPGTCGCGVPDVDTDADTTLDCDDGCPLDSTKTLPGVCGCGVADVDTDADTTLDCADGCPMDPAKTSPGACGCGVADIDTDADTTLDCGDGCPMDPAKTSPGPCGCGVADTDTDADTTPDCVDGCPGDPAKTDPGACGCGVLETDTDADTTPDCVDGCPMDPAKSDPGACGCGVPDTDSDGDTTPDCVDGCPMDPAKTDPGACGCGVADTDMDADGTPDCIDGCPTDVDAIAPAACCAGMSCAMLCPAACGRFGGTWMGAGTACTDIPDPCVPSACVAPGPFTGLAKQPGGSTILTGAGLPTTAPTDLHDVDSSSGASLGRGLTLALERQWTWNFTGARDGAGDRHYTIGGRPDQPAIGSDVVTIDTATATLVDDVPLSPQVDFVHVDFDHSSRVLYGLVVETGGLSLGVHMQFNGMLSLVVVDPATGVVTTVASGLPEGLDHYAATLDSEGDRYFYHVATGVLHAVDLVTGARTSVSVPEDIADLQFDDATGTLYGLRITNNTGISGSAAEGWRTNGSIDLVEISPTSGALTVLNAAALPAGTTNWASAFDCDNRHYLYVSADGNSNVLDVATGALLSTSAPPPGERHASLD